jgi:plasmid stability protein
MATLTIEDVPDELLRRLREQAASRRQSLSQQALGALRRGMERDEPPPATDAEAQARAWGRLAGRWKSDESAEKEIRGIYDARSIGREVPL